MRVLAPGRLLLPLAIHAGALASTLVAFPGRADEAVFWLSAYAVPPLGREAVIPALVARGFDPVLVVAYILVLDAAACLFLLWNWHRIRELPRVGRLAGAVQDKAQAFLRRHPRLQKASFLSLVAYAVVPHQGGGGVGTSVVGLSLGYGRRRIFAAVLGGSALACALLAAGASAAFAVLGDGLWILVLAGMALGIAGIAFVALARGRARPRPQPEPDPDPSAWRLPRFRVNAPNLMPSTPLHPAWPSSPTAVAPALPLPAAAAIAAAPDVVGHGTESFPPPNA